MQCIKVNNLGKQTRKGVTWKIGVLKIVKGFDFE